MGPRPPRPATVQESKAPSFSRPKESVHAQHGHSPPHEGVLTPQPLLRKKPTRELAEIVANGKFPMAPSAQIDPGFVYCRAGLCGSSRDRIPDSAIATTTLRDKVKTIPGMEAVVDPQLLDEVLVWRICRWGERYFHIANYLLL